MGHNPSQRSIERAVRREEANRRKLAGWSWNGSRLEPLATVEGLFAQGGVLTARCRTEECRRHVQLNLHWWVRHGLGETSLSVAQQSYRCSRLGRGLTWQAESYPAGLPLQYFVGTEVRLEAKCRRCQAGRSYSAEEILGALEAAGTGAGNVGVNELGRRIRGVCRACRYPGWIVELRRPPVGPGGLPA